MKKLSYSIRMTGGHDLTGDSTIFKIVLQTTRQGDANELLSTLRESVRRISAETGTTGKLCVLDGKHQFLPNVTAMRAVYRNMLTLASEQYSDEEQQFVKKLQQHLVQDTLGISYQLLPFTDQSSRESLYGYTSDIGDASWIAPEIYFVVETLPAVPMHQWPGTIFSGHPIGHRGMLRAAKILAMTIVDFVKDESLRQSIHAEFRARIGDYRYQVPESCDSP